MYIVICVLHSETVKCVNMHLLESRTCKLIAEIEENPNQWRVILYPGWKDEI